MASSIGEGDCLYDAVSPLACEFNGYFYIISDDLDEDYCEMVEFGKCLPVVAKDGDDEEAAETKVFHNHEISHISYRS